MKTTIEKEDVDAIWAKIVFEVRKEIREKITEALNDHRRFMHTHMAEVPHDTSGAERAGYSWNMEEENSLIESLRCFINERARRHRRTPGAIASRLRQRYQTYLDALGPLD